MEIEERYFGSVSELVQRVNSGESTQNCTVLDFDDEEIDDDEVSQLCTVLDRFTALQTLGLRGNSISSTGVSALCRILPQCTRLTVLNLSENSINSEAAKRIAESLKHTKLVQLYLSGNSIGSDGICALFLSVANSETLRELYISGNSGLEQSVSEIVEILPHCNTLRELWLGNSQFPLSDEFRQRIRSEMEKCSTSLTVALGVGDTTTQPLDRSSLYEIAERIGFSGFLSTHKAPLFDEITDSALAAMHSGSLRVFRCRVAFVGDSRVGKTWTAKSLRGEENVHPKTAAQSSEERTPGAESSALCIGDITVTNVEGPALPPEVSSGELPVGSDARLGVDSPVDDTMVASAEAVDTALPTASTVSASTVPTAVETVPEQHGSGTLRVYDKVRSFRFPEGVDVADPDKTVCYMTLWDFGGQLMYHSWYQFYFAPGMIPCVVFDLLLIVGKRGDDSFSPRQSLVDTIVHYAQQAVHFGGSDCRVLLVGTKAGALSESLQERKAVATKAFETIFASSPPSLQTRYYGFCYTDASTSMSQSVQSAGIQTSVCAVENEKGNEDDGVQILWKSLIRECMRPPDATTGMQAEAPSGFGHGTSVSAAVGTQDVGSSVDHIPRTDLERQTPSSDDFRVALMEARKRFLNNEVPRHWYDYEKSLHKRSDIQLQNACTVNDLWLACDQSQFAGDFEFVAMLGSMASAGAVILTVGIPWSEIAAHRIVPERFLHSTVITRPQWIIEIARALLPFPEDGELQYKSRKSQPVANNEAWGDSVDTLWKHAVANLTMLRAVLGDKLDTVIDLFESRLVLWKMHSTDTDADMRQWFVPSMVVFHAERKTAGIGGTVKKCGTSNFCLRLKLSWVPPGFPLLFVGSMLQGTNVEPKFSICTLTGAIQFVVGYPRCRPLVYIDLLQGAGGSEIQVWMKRSLTAELRDVMVDVSRRVLTAIHAACTRLRVEPLLEKPRKTVPRGLVVKLNVPLFPLAGAKVPLQMCKLKQLCRGDDSDLPDGCNVPATKTLYWEILSQVSCIPVPDEWVSGLEEACAVANDEHLAEIPMVDETVQRLHRTELSGPAASPSSNRDVLVEKLSPAKKFALKCELVKMGKWPMWGAAALLGLDKALIEAETDDSELLAYADIIINKCAYRLESEVLNAIEKATAMSG